MMREPEILPVDEKRALYIVADGDGDDRRFALLLTEVWESLPETARDSMDAFWDTFAGRDWTRQLISDPEATKVPIPFIQLSSRMAGHYNMGRLSDDGYRAAYVWQGGSVIHFDAAFFGHASNLAIKGIIAHELAHVARLSEGIQFPSDKTSREYEETQTDRLAVEWGFAQELDAFRNEGQNWERPPRPQEPEIDEDEDEEAYKAAEQFLYGGSYSVPE